MSPVNQSYFFYYRIKTNHKNKIPYFIRRNNALLVVDAVATLGAAELNVDELKIDVCFSGSQKVLGAAAGLAPITFSSRAIEVIVNRKVPSNVFFFDTTNLSTAYRCDDKPHL